MENIKNTYHIYTGQLAHPLFDPSLRRMCRLARGVCSLYEQYVGPRQEKMCFRTYADSEGPDQTAKMRSLIRPRGFFFSFFFFFFFFFFHFFMLNSTEHEICPANKSQITNDFKFFLAKHS